METTTKKTEAKRIYNLIIVDESGSMSCIYNEALDGINETIRSCRKIQELNPEIEQRITLVTFDSDNYKVHYDNANVREVSPLTKKDYDPNGGTPLYDAIGRSIARLHCQTEEKANVLVTIITDGEENMSQEYSLSNIRNLIEKQKKQGWTFALIGTDDIDVRGMAYEMAIENHLIFEEESNATQEMFAKDLRSRMRYVDRCSLFNEPTAVSDYFAED